MSEHEGGLCAEKDALRDLLAEAIYAGGEEAEWLTTVDGSPNSASYEIADRVLSVLPMRVSVQQGWKCKHGIAGPYAARGARAACDDENAVPMRRLFVEQYIGEWAEARAEALRAMAVTFRDEASEAWGMDATWLTTGEKVALLAADWCDEEASAVLAGQGGESGEGA